MESDGIPDELKSVEIPLGGRRIGLEEFACGISAVDFEAFVGGDERGVCAPPKIMENFLLISYQV